MLQRFVAVIEKDPNSAFGVWFPDVEGCFSAGETLDEAITNASQALRQHCEALESAGRSISKARSIEVLQREKEVRNAIRSGAVLFAVPLLADAGRTVRLNITLDKALIDEIDAAATERGLTRSAFLAQAAREKIIR